MILFKDRKTLSTKPHFHTLIRKLIPPYFTSFSFNISNVLVWLVIISGCFAAGCKKPYTPAIINSDNSYLVVEGGINSGNDSTIISLSKTVKIADTARVNPVNGYIITVEAEGGNEMYNLKPLASGKYAIGPMALNGSKRYRLHIVAPEGKEYATDYLEVMNNPPIDSISFGIKASSLDLYVSTHDPNNRIKYYRWEYEEDWEFHAKSFTQFIVDGDTLRKRKPEEQIFYCFAHDRSSDIAIGTTEKLNQAVVLKSLVASIPSTAEKIGTKYSILVKQYALDKGAYDFWDNLRKNTEKIGSIFDAQPSILKGNIRCVSNPDEPVIGYTTISNTQVKRFFIAKVQLPTDWYPDYPYACGISKAFFSAPVTGHNDVLSFLINGNGQYLPIEYTLDGYLYTTPPCGDCSVRGKLKAPSFWQ
jgi:hypothetical protein